MGDIAGQVASIRLGEEPARYGQWAVQFVSRTTDRQWTPVSAVDSALVGKTVLVRARLHAVRGTGKHAFLVLRQRHDTLQAVVTVEEEGVDRAMVRFAGGIARESIVDVEGLVVRPEIPIAGCSVHDYELRVGRVFVVHGARETPPFTLEDAARGDRQDGLPRVLLDTRLNHRVVDLRTATNQAIFAIQAGAGRLFRAHLDAHGFTEIHSPKLTGAASEGGASVFKVSYFRGTAYLAQSPQFSKQMAIAADFDRVYEVGPVFRAENSLTHRHLTEFMGLDLEMTIREDYMEVVRFVMAMLAAVFAGLERDHARELQTVREQYPTEPFVYSPEPTVLAFGEGLALLRAAGVEMADDADLSTENERRLGAIVKARYGTDFYALVQYPLAVRPFYTMPSATDGACSNSYDMFMRGEEILSGAQRIHDPELLAARARQHGVDLESIRPYLDAFAFGAWPHGGAGLGLERIVMLYLNLGNIRNASLFPRDPHRLNP